jgi:hypothetical protein
MIPGSSKAGSVLEVDYPDGTYLDVELGTDAARRSDVAELVMDVLISASDRHSAFEALNDHLDEVGCTVTSSNDHGGIEVVVDAGDDRRPPADYTAGGTMSEASGRRAER